MNPLLPLLDEAKVLICVGTGGVGKTTTASALGYLAAKRGKKVLVLTIDPSQRLRTTLGIEGDQDSVQVPVPELQGRLWASVVNHKRTFDDFVKRAARSEAAAELILKNKLYIQLSTSLSGSQEFTALERLYSAAEKQEFDLVILDTPPAHHAIDFVNSPQKLAALFNEGIAKWFRNPDAADAGFFKKFLNVGTKQVLRALESLTGSEFIHELSDFFTNVFQWQDRLENRVQQVQKLLAQPSTQFLLVTSLDPVKLRESEEFGREIQKSGFHLAGCLFNRSYPFWFDEPAGSSVTEKEIRDYYQERSQMAESLREKNRWVVKVPELRENINDIETVAKMALVLEGLQ